jgi:hypothetical protein
MFREPLDKKGSFADPVDEPADLRRREVTADLHVTRDAPQFLELCLTRDKLKPPVQPGADELVGLRVDPDQGAQQDVRIKDDPQRRAV